jgi:hypothetical protein
MASRPDRHHARKSKSGEQEFGSDLSPPARWISSALHGVFPLAHFLISGLFVLCAIGLLVGSGYELWNAMDPWANHSTNQRVGGVLQTIALLTVAVAALELGQTILEEEVQRRAHMSTPTRVRRFLSRFMIVLVVSLSIEGLVVVFKASNEAPEHLPYAAAIGFMAAALLLAWGAFIWFNRSVELLEPEAMREAKGEDKKFA